MMSFDCIHWHESVDQTAEILSADPTQALSRRMTLFVTLLYHTVWGIICEPVWRCLFLFYGV